MTDLTLGARTLPGDQRTDVLADTWEVLAQRARWRQVGASPLAAVYAGIAVVLVGFVVIVYTWVKVAAITNVGLQMPYVVSGGFTALALIMTGLLVITVSARRQDAIERARQMDVLITVVADLNERLDALEQHG
jgi:hypothetical protein